jgi:hypothetical protein
MRSSSCRERVGFWLALRLLGFTRFDELTPRAECDPRQEHPRTCGSGWGQSGLAPQLDSAARNGPIINHCDMIERRSTHVGLLRRLIARSLMWLGDRIES